MRLTSDKARRDVSRAGEFVDDNSILIPAISMT